MKFLSSLKSNFAVSAKSLTFYLGAFAAYLAATGHADPTKLTLTDLKVAIFGFILKSLIPNDQPAG